MLGVAGNCSGSLEIAQWNRMNSLVRCSQMIQENHRSGRTRFPSDRITKTVENYFGSLCGVNHRHHFLELVDTIQSNFWKKATLWMPSNWKDWNLIIHHGLINWEYLFFSSLDSNRTSHHKSIQDVLTTWVQDAVFPGRDFGSNSDAGLLLWVHGHIQPGRAGLQL